MHGGDNRRRRRHGVGYPVPDGSRNVPEPQGPQAARQVAVCQRSSMSSVVVVTPRVATAQSASSTSPKRIRNYTPIATKPALSGTF